MRNLSKPILIGATTAAVAAGIGLYSIREHHRPKQFEMFVFDEKGGPAYFIRTPEDQRILINGGANADIIRRITNILPFYSRRIDSIIATTDSSNGVTGLIDVIDRYDIGSAYIPGLNSIDAGISTTTDPIYSTFISRLSEKKIPVHEVMAGDNISFGGNVFAKIQFPVPTSSFAYSKASPPELVLQVQYGATAIELIGSISKKIQKEVASSSEQSQLLITSLNDSSGSFSGEFIDVLNPEKFIYSKSLTAKPSQPSKMKRPVKVPIDPLASILNTDRFNIKERGMIHIVSDGNRIVVNRAI